MNIKLFSPAPHKELLPLSRVDPEYKKQRIKVFLGIFLGYAGYYLVRKNFSLAMPDLIDQGFSKAQLGFALSGVSIAYGLSKFLMGNVSDRSNARNFLLFINGWFQGMGWPPCGRVVVHWYSIKERGTMMSIWNVAHNVGGGLVGPIAILAIEIFADWHSKFYFPGIIALFFAVIAYILVRGIVAACVLSIFFTALTWNREKRNLAAM